MGGPVQLLDWQVSPLPDRSSLPLSLDRRFQLRLLQEKDLSPETMSSEHVVLSVPVSQPLFPELWDEAHSGGEHVL